MKCWMGLGEFVSILDSSMSRSSNRSPIEITLGKRDDAGEGRPFGTRLGGQRETVFGLAGLGDLLTTGFSAHSRNRTLGELLGKAADWQHFLRTNTVEGVTACRSITELAGDPKRLPLLALLYDILFAEAPAPASMRRFLESFSYADAVAL